MSTQQKITKAAIARLREMRQELRGLIEKLQGGTNDDRPPKGGWKRRKDDQDESPDDDDDDDE